MKFDAVFEGGGVKAYGLVGALHMVLQHGYTPSHVAGTSAGAIVASLVTAGYNGEEMAVIMESLDPSKMTDGSFPLVRLLFKRGLYKGDYIYEWIKKLLADKGIVTFADVKDPNEWREQYKYRLQVIASDISRGTMLVLPRSIAEYGYDPDGLEVAAAIRWSISIPVFYVPCRIKHETGWSTIVDGGILSNFPVWLMDSGPDPQWPTFGFRLTEPNLNRSATINNVLDLCKHCILTMSEAHDKQHVSERDWVRTIAVPSPNGIHFTDFGITVDQRMALYEAGQIAAAEFLAGFDWEQYKQTRAVQSIGGGL